MRVCVPPLKYKATEAGIAVVHMPHLVFISFQNGAVNRRGCKRFDFPEIKLEKIEPKLLEHWPGPTV
jgi:hypothetical protein